MQRQKVLLLTFTPSFSTSVHFFSLLLSYTQTPVVITNNALPTNYWRRFAKQVLVMLYQLTTANDLFMNAHRQRCHYWQTGALLYRYYDTYHDWFLWNNLYLHMLMFTEWVTWCMYRHKISFEWYLAFFFFFFFFKASWSHGIKKHLHIIWYKMTEI